MMRASRSVVPPGAKPTMIFTVWFGKSVSARAGQASVAQHANAMSGRTHENVISFSPSLERPANGGSTPTPSAERSEDRKSAPRRTTVRHTRRSSRPRRRRRYRPPLPFDAERVARGRRKRDELAAHGGKIGRRRHEIIRERRGDHLSGIVVAQMLHERAAEPLQDRTQRLPVRDERVEHAPDILDRNEVDQLDAAG